MVLLLSQASPSQLYAGRLTQRQGPDFSSPIICIWHLPSMNHSSNGVPPFAERCVPRPYHPGSITDGSTMWAPNIIRVCSMGQIVGSCKLAAIARAWPNAFREYTAMPAVVFHPPCCRRRSSDCISICACAPDRHECGTKRDGSSPASMDVR